MKRQKARMIDADWIGIGLIAIGIGCLQIFMDRGEDEDWFGSGFITMMFAFALVGISGAVVWLTTVDKPVVNLKVFLDRNFALGTLMIGGVGAVLYSGAVLVPQLGAIGAWLHGNFGRAHPVTWRDRHRRSDPFRDQGADAERADPLHHRLRFHPDRLFLFFTPA